MGDKIWLVDNEPSKRYPVYTRGNVGEVFPDVVAPLSWTAFGIPGAEPGWRDAWERFGCFDPDEFDPDNLEIVGVFGGYCYLNVSISRIFGVRTPGLTPELVDYTIFGEQADAPPYQPSPTDESPKHTERITETMGWIFSATELPELRRDQERVAELRASRPDLDSLSNDDILRRTEELLPIFRELYAQHIYISYCALLAMGTVTITSLGLGDPTIAMPLVAGLGDVDSAGHSFAMWELGREATETAAVAAEFERGLDELDERLRANPDCARFVSSFETFLSEHGSRGPNEWESRSPTWETKPRLALAAIDRMRVAAEAQSPRRQLDRLAAQREDMTKEVLAKLDGDARTQMQGALAASKLFLAGRERTKTTVVKFIHEIRVMLHRFGQRMVAEGVFDKPENFGMLTRDELDAFLGDPKAWTDTIREREELFTKLQGLVPPFVINGEVPPVDTWERRSTDPRHEASGAVLQGIPGCPGEATGRARVILSPFDARGLEPGDVLVAPITDPSWTPLFVPASAVVVDVGAQLSHAVIVSRELGIPCVVSVTDGTRRIRDGAQVRVDGTTGTVSIL